MGVIAGSALSLATFTVAASDWPSRPVTLVVPQGTGSGSDVVARLLGDEAAGETAHYIEYDWQSK